MKRLKKRDTLRSAPCRLAKEPHPEALRLLMPVTSEKASSSLSPFNESKLAWAPRPPSLGAWSILADTASAFTAGNRWAMRSWQDQCYFPQAQPCLQEVAMDSHRRPWTAVQTFFHAPPQEKQNCTTTSPHACVCFCACLATAVSSAVAASCNVRVSIQTHSQDSGTGGKTAARWTDAYPCSALCMLLKGALGCSGTLRAMSVSLLLMSV